MKSAATVFSLALLLQLYKFIRLKNLIKYYSKIAEQLKNMEVLSIK